MAKKNIAWIDRDSRITGYYPRWIAEHDPDITIEIFSGNEGHLEALAAKAYDLIVFNPDLTPRQCASVHAPPNSPSKAYAAKRNYLDEGITDYSEGAKLFCRIKEISPEVPIIVAYNATRYTEGPQGVFPRIKEEDFPGAAMVTTFYSHLPSGFHRDIVGRYLDNEKKRE